MVDPSSTFKKRAPAHASTRMHLENVKQRPDTSEDVLHYSLYGNFKTRQKQSLATQVHTFIKLNLFTVELWFYFNKNKKHLAAHSHVSGSGTVRFAARGLLSEQGKRVLLPGKALWQLPKAVERIQVWAFSVSRQRLAVKFNPVNGLTARLV